MSEEVKALVLKTPGFPTVTIVPTKADQKFMVDLKVKVQEDGKVVPDESNLVDLDSLIQTYKDQCGMEAAKRMIKLGQASPEDFADDGKGSYDGTNIPETAQGRANAAVIAQKQADAVKAKYGIDPGQDLTQEQFENIIKNYIAANPDKFVAPVAKAQEGGNE